MFNIWELQMAQPGHFFSHNQMTKLTSSIFLTFYHQLIECLERRRESVYFIKAVTLYIILIEKE